MQPSKHPLYQYRTTRKITRKALAQQIGCSTRSLYRWERGQTYPQMAWAIRASKVTDLSMNALFTDAEVLE